MQITGGSARLAFTHAVAGHRQLAVVIGTALLFSSALAGAAIRAPGLHLVVVGIGFAIYASIATIAVLGWPLWLTVVPPLAGAVTLLAVGAPDAVAAPGLVVTLLVYSMRSERTPVIVVKASVIVVLVVADVLAHRFARANLSDLQVVPWAVVAGAIGQAVRSRRAYVAMLEERARRAEEDSEDEARKRVAAERLRIARELHDAVGHHVAIISVQSGAMTYLLDADTEKARESLAHIQRASEDALDELRLTVGLLRQPGEAEPVEPPGGLSRLGELIDSFSTTGLAVTCEITGAARKLPEAVDLTAFRVVQESLTNTAKHAPGASASVRLFYLPEMLRLEVTDDGPPVLAPRGDDIGHGLIGMRERAAAVGGWLAARPGADRGFRVVAELPA